MGNGPRNFFGSYVINQVLITRLVTGHWLSWVFKPQERKKKRKKDHDFSHSENRTQNRCRLVGKVSAGFFFLFFSCFREFGHLRHQISNQTSDTSDFTKSNVLDVWFQIWHLCPSENWVRSWIWRLRRLIWQNKQNCGVVRPTINMDSGPNQWYPPISNSGRKGTKSW